MLKLILPFILISIIGCTPSGGGSRSFRSNATVSPFPNLTPTVSGPIGIENDIVWDSGGFFFESLLTIRADFNTTLSLRGVSVNNFLTLNNNMDMQYCMVIDLNTTNVNARKQLRFRLTPARRTNLQGNVEYLFIARINETVDNQNNCQGTLPFIDQDGQVTTIANNDIAYSPSQVCANCNITTPSRVMNIYRRNATSFDNEPIDSTSIPINSLSLAINNNSVPVDPSTCTDTSCQRLGFDCCLEENQCVTNGTIKPSFINSLDPEFLQAQALVSISETNKVRFPQFYNICPIGEPTTPTPTPTPDNILAAENRLIGLILDYHCQQENIANSNTSRCYADNQCFQGEVDLAQISAGIFTNIDLSNCVESFAEYERRTLIRCGCISGDSSSCPEYELIPDRDDNNIIRDVDCETIDPNPIVAPNSRVRVPGRTAPHRLFRTLDGAAIDSIEGLQSIQDSPLFPYQEGEFFSYLDSNAQLSSNQENFSMNAILGQMRLDLTGARPATMVEVVRGQFYQIFTDPDQSSHVPCPNCSRDSWSQGRFTSFPSTDNGEGLRAFGVTSSRRDFSFNRSGGNYEDTLFGRACFVPPTMLPFSHRENTDVQQQRLNRLKTQAAMYVNGYKRDWFGFNQGALIGSFNGVNWFAIGSGRRVLSTSTKLFLAINAPFADVASNQDLSVLVSPTDDSNGGLTTFPEEDYTFGTSPYSISTDPTVADALSTSQGASCQAFHQCNTDSDCISQLGWEYMCADTGSYRSLMPEFLDDATEISGSTSAGFDEILTNPDLAATSRRCVYRGAGAPCKKDYTTLRTQIQKLYTCAPNFYCASLNETFSAQIHRSVRNDSNALYGQAAPFLGRPQNYVGGSSPLPPEVIETLRQNATNQDSSFDQDDVGLCRPGKFLDVNNPEPNFLTQHQNRDGSMRTDYISQIGSCDSNASSLVLRETALRRTQTCPLIDFDGDYLYTKDINPQISDPFIQDQFPIQNSCGGESIETGTSRSPFDEIEAANLIPNPIFQLIQTETLVRNACFRRAGSVCFTNLDCSPNSLHSTQANLHDVSFFGGTAAEKNYWEESLICAQPSTSQQTTIEDFATFDITQNRCCREVGSEITMYTQGDPQTANENPNLDVTLFASGDPNGEGRYSRYSIAGFLETTDTDPNAEPFNSAPIMPTDDNSPTRFQWRTINQTATNTCCGGGWVRKFADGTNDWTQANRLSLDPSDMSCINANTSLALERPDKVTSSAYGRDFFRLCEDPSQNGCVEVSMQASDGFRIINPIFDLDFGGNLEIVGGARVAAMNTFLFGTEDDTIDSEGEIPNTQRKSFFVPFLPTVVDGDGPRGENSLNNFFDASREYLSIRLPSYINDRINIANVYSTNTDGERNQQFLNCEEAGLCSVCDPSQNQATEWIAGVVGDNRNWWCYNESTGILHAKRARQVAASMPALGLYIEFYPVNTPDHRYGPNSAPVLEPFRTGVYQPGNDLYYLTKLARFELIGIPQIFYEPVYCNSNVDNVIPNLFREDNGNDIINRSQFESTGYVYNGAEGRLSQIYDSDADGIDVVNSLDTGTSQVQFVVNQENLANPAVFSGHEFKCCLNLGSVATSANQCCSNFIGPENPDQPDESAIICKLPVSTDLNVYFNRFVSGDGTDPEPAVGLIDEDFNPTTGEPRLQASTFQKLQALGRRYCEIPEIRFGAAFGEFQGEPNAGSVVTPLDEPLTTTTRYTFVDSSTDFAPSFTDSPSSLQFFNAGFRWNHHVYCSDRIAEDDN